MSEQEQIKHQQFMQRYEPLHHRLDRFIQTLVWDRNDAKDVLSETILIAYEKFHTLREPDKFRSFLFSIAANLVRSGRRRKKFYAAVSEEEWVEYPGGSGAESKLARRELYELLDKLKPKHREALVLFELSGFTIKEIAEIQHLSESGVKSNLLRAREKLARLVQEAPLENSPVRVQLNSERSHYGK